MPKGKGVVVIRGQGGKTVITTRAALAHDKAEKKSDGSSQKAGPWFESHGARKLNAIKEEDELQEHCMGLTSAATTAIRTLSAVRRLRERGAVAQLLLGFGNEGLGLADVVDALGGHPLRFIALRRITIDVPREPPQPHRDRAGAPGTAV